MLLACGSVRRNCLVSTHWSKPTDFQSVPLQRESKSICPYPLENEPQPGGRLIFQRVRTCNTTPAATVCSIARQGIAQQCPERGSPLPHRPADEVSRQGADRRHPASGAGHLPPGLPRAGCRHHPWRAVGRPCPHVRIGAAKSGDQRPGAADEGTIVAQGAAGVPSPAKALPGKTLLGQRLLFNHQRRHPLPGRALRSNVPKGTEDIVLQYLEQHIADPTGASR